MKVLNLYAGIGGNRYLWGNDIEVTAVEINEQIASVYKGLFPNDTVIVGDAHQYLLNHYKEFDFIWASPPCPTHSRLCFSQPRKTYPSMVLYQEILLLKSWYKGKWVMENVIPYYNPLIKPTVELSRHYFWSNFDIPQKKFDMIDIARAKPRELAEFLNIDLPNCSNGAKLLRNCVNPKVGKHIFDYAFKEVQMNLKEVRE